MVHKDRQALQFISIPLSDIYPSVSLPGSIFLYVNGKFIQYKMAGDDIPDEKYELFIMKKMHYLFIQLEEKDKFNQWTKGISDKIKNEMSLEIGVENVDIIDRHIEMKDDVLSFISREITDESVKEIINKTRDFIQKISEQQTPEKFLAKLMTYGQGTLDHAVNVGSLSTFLAMSAGYSQQIILENIYLGAILHDYGKTRIDPKYLEDPDSAIFKTAMKKHPMLGKTALLCDAGFPDGVLRIIQEHHERHDGKGYPKGLKGNKIFDLTKIVSIANTFDNYVQQVTGTPLERQQKALAAIKIDKAQKFDPVILEKCVAALSGII